MRLLIEEYGKMLAAVIICSALLGILFTGFMRKWQEFGGVDDSIKTDFNTDEEKRTPPVLIARDVKVHSGEPVDVAEYVSASDFDGSDLSSLVQKDCLERKEGVIRYALKVTSPVTGKSVTGRILILIDCPGDGGDRLVCGS